MIFDSRAGEVLRTHLPFRLRHGWPFVVKGAKEEIEVERHRFSGLVLYEVTSDQLDQLEKETLSVSEDLTFATVGATAGLSFLIALLTTNFTSDRTFYVFFIICVIGFLTAAYFGFKWVRGRKAATTTITRIKKSVGPLGEEGKEISPTTGLTAAQPPKPRGAP